MTNYVFIIGGRINIQIRNKIMDQVSKRTGYKIVTKMAWVDIFNPKDQIEKSLKNKNERTIT